eukprot:5278444-Amphidinium_carterae.1
MVVLARSFCSALFNNGPANPKAVSSWPAPALKPASGSRMLRPICYAFVRRVSRQLALDFHGMKRKGHAASPLANSSMQPGSTNTSERVISRMA